MLLLCFPCRSDRTSESEFAWQQDSIVWILTNDHCCCFSRLISVSFESSAASVMQKKKKKRTEWLTRMQIVSTFGLRFLQQADTGWFFSSKTFAPDHQTAGEHHEIICSLIPFVFIGPVSCLCLVPLSEDKTQAPPPLVGGAPFTRHVQITWSEAEEKSPNRCPLLIQMQRMGHKSPQLTIHHCLSLKNIKRRKLSNSTLTQTERSSLMME